MAKRTTPKRADKVTALTVIETPAAAELHLHGHIGSEVIAEQIIGRLAALREKPVDVHINSPGGFVSESMAIYSALTAHPQKVTTYVDGLAASGASIVAMAGSEIVMAENAMLMIHNASGLTVGDARAHRDMADLLDKMNGVAAKVYADRTGRTVGSVVQMMDDETWLTAEEAMENGFADRLIPNKTKNEDLAKMLAGCQMKYSRVPASLKTTISLCPTGVDGAACAVAFSDGKPTLPTEDTDMATASEVEQLKAENAKLAADLEAAKAKIPPAPIPAKAHELKAAFPDDPGFVIDQIGASATMEQAKAAYADILSARQAKLQKDLDAAKSDLDKVTKGQDAIGMSVKPAAPQSPVENVTEDEKYTAEYKANPELRKAFGSERAYVLFRQNEAKGNVTIK
jgi:ATP-dependent protease ClpP protease subunit